MRINIDADWKRQIVCNNFFIISPQSINIHYGFGNKREILVVVISNIFVTPDNLDHAV